MLYSVFVVDCLTDERFKFDSLLWTRGMCSLFFSFVVVVVVDCLAYEKLVSRFSRFY